MVNESDYDDYGTDPLTGFKYLWPVDFDLPSRDGGDFGQPKTIAHARRCQGTRKHIRPKVQCGRWAVKGRNYCKVHGGNNYTQNRPSTLLKYYSKNGGAILKQKLEELSAMGADRMSLAGEVDVARLLASRYVEIFEKTCLDPDSSASGTAKALAVQGLKESITLVTDVASKAAKVMDLTDQTFSIDQLDGILSQVLRIVEYYVPEEHAPKVKEAIQNIQLPSSGGKADPKRVAQEMRKLANEVADLRDNETGPSAE